jgi:hypothetical protein
MDYFQWAEDNLDVRTPHELQDRGVQVYFSPNIASNERLVDLENGNVRTYHDGEDRPQVGYYAEERSLERYCREHGLPFYETSGTASVD